MINHDHIFVELETIIQQYGFLRFYIDDVSLLFLRLTSAEHQLILIERINGLEFYNVYYFVFFANNQLKYVDLAKTKSLIYTIFTHRSLLIDFNCVEQPGNDEVLVMAKDLKRYLK